MPQPPTSDPTARGLEGLAQVSPMLAHELRNPLAAIKGHAQLLVELLPPDDDRHDRAERVVAEVARLERLVDDLLELASGASARMERRSPAMVAEAAAARAPGLVRVVSERAPPDWNLDVERVGQALDRLLSCGLSCLNGRGEIELRVSAAGDALEFRIFYKINKQYYNNSNIRIFDIDQCSGLGMAIVRRAAALHRGDVQRGADPEGGVVLLLRDRVVE